MGLFDIFKSKPLEIVNTNKKKSPFELFSIEFNSLPDNSFQIMHESETEDGNKIVTYSKHLHTKELGLFDALEIVQFGSGNKNYLFKGLVFNSNESQKIKLLVNQLFEIYGNDDVGKGKFDQYDQIDIEDGFWTGRMWNSEPHNPHLNIMGDTEEGVSLTIWT